MGTAPVGERTPKSGIVTRKCRHLVTLAQTLVTENTMDTHVDEAWVGDK